MSDAVVLLAEDEPGLRRIFAAALRSAGMEVLAAADGAEALSLAEARDGPIALLVSDVRMPRVGGFELARRLRQERPGLPVLFLSGTEEPTPGGEPLLAKPFRLTQLADRALELAAG